MIKRSPDLKWNLNPDLLPSNEEGSIICKMEPLNLCFNLDQDGKMHPIGAHRPVRVLRIYK